MSGKAGGKTPGAKALRSPPKKRNKGGKKRNPPQNRQGYKPKQTKGPRDPGRQRPRHKPLKGHGRIRDGPPQSLPDVSGLARIDGKLATLNSTPGYRVYDERLVKKGKNEYRIWDPHRSKVAAALAKGLRDLPIGSRSKVLYLGASSGTTASHIADLAKTVWCVEFSKRMMRQLLLVCEKKRNMVPILADARHPWEYCNTIGEVDALIQDVAQPDQAQILLNNHDQFGFEHALLSIKARSINSAKDPRTIYEAETQKLEGRFGVVQKLGLAPFEEDHMLLHLKER